NRQLPPPRRVEELRLEFHLEPELKLVEAHRAHCAKPVHRIAREPLAQLVAHAIALRDPAEAVEHAEAVAAWIIARKAIPLERGARAVRVHELPLRVLEVREAADARRPVLVEEMDELAP